MNNLEAYKEELLRITSEDECAVVFYTNELKPCSTVDCSDCLFKAGSCVEGLIRWLSEEYRKPKECFLTPDEYSFCILFEDGYIMRDVFGNLFYSEDVPSINLKYGTWHAYNMVKLKKEHFPFITWESKESWSIEKLKKLPVKDIGAKND